MPCTKDFDAVNSTVRNVGASLTDGPNEIGPNSSFGYVPFLVTPWKVEGQSSDDGHAWQGDWRILGVIGTWFQKKKGRAGGHGGQRRIYPRRKRTAKESKTPLEKNWWWAARQSLSPKLKKLMSRSLAEETHLEKHIQDSPRQPRENECDEIPVKGPSRYNNPWLTPSFLTTGIRKIRTSTCARTKTHWENERTVEAPQQFRSAVSSSSIPAAIFAISLRFSHFCRVFCLLS